MAAVVRSVEQLARQARGHRRLAAVARGGYQPADRERLRAVGADFDGNLIGRTADAADAPFDVRTAVGARFVEHAARFLLGAGLARFESAIDDAFGDGLSSDERREGTGGVCTDEFGGERYTKT